MAVGSTFVAGKQVPQAQLWNGTSWQLTTPLEFSAGDLASVSCTSATSCTAVGRKAGQDAMLVDHWDGANWKVQVTPHPPGAGRLAGVSCASATSCVAVGSDFSEILVGTSWSYQATATITGSQGIDLSGVSCTASGACTAVGLYFSAKRGPLTLAERWNGAAWHKQPTPNVRGAQRNLLAGVSCSSASACSAVGERAASDFTAPQSLIEHWNGTGWSMQAAPSPAGPTFSELFGVSCATARACTATGLYALLNGPALTFAVATR